MVTSTVDPQASGIGRDSTGESVCCRAAAILVKSPYLTLRTLRCNYEEGKLTLQGEVLSQAVGAICDQRHRVPQQSHESDSCRAARNTRSGKIAASSAAALLIEEAIV